MDNLAFLCQEDQKRGGKTSLGRNYIFICKQPLCKIFSYKTTFFCRQTNILGLVINILSANLLGIHRKHNKRFNNFARVSDYGLLGIVIQKKCTVQISSTAVQMKRDFVDTDSTYKDCYTMKDQAKLFVFLILNILKLSHGVEDIEVKNKESSPLQQNADSNDKLAMDNNEKNLLSMMDGNYELDCVELFYLLKTGSNTKFIYLDDESCKNSIIIICMLSYLTLYKKYVIITFASVLVRRNRTHSHLRLHSDRCCSK